uniref:hypothetical protein n=1 Tax=Rheinheimera sp. TaxID=1869214 RepID=UPI004048B87D
MRYVDLQQVEACKPVNWDLNARGWLASISLAVDKKAAFKALGSVWSPFKDNFINAFGDKCWYSEVPRINTDFDVDHFRPKGAVKKAKKNYAKRIVNGVLEIHPGYWWLAFEPKNYRYACQYANQPRDNGGKHDYFPLTDENMRVWSQSAFTAHANETPHLLDPCNQADVQLLSFDKSPGMAHSRYDLTAYPDLYSRVQISARCYNLNHKTVRGHRLKVINDVCDDLKLLEAIWGLPPAYKAMMQVQFDAAELRLIKACARKSSFSAAAVAFVKPKIAEPWIANVLSRLDLTP